MKPSVLKRLLYASMTFGLIIGLIFPFFADLFVAWKPGMFGWFFVSAVAAGLTVGGFNYWLVNVILVSRLRRIAEVASQISERNLTHTCSMESHDTVGEIINAFNKMAGNLRGLIGEMGSMSGQVEQDTQVIQKLVGEVRDRFVEQHETTKQIVGAMDQFSNTVSDISATAGQVADSAREAVALAQTGGKVVDETVAGMGVIESTVSQASADIHQLGARSDEIGAIIATIRGIADQTNLLALNAAIEAARAGEQGRGFAVVADEVRKLAEKTGTSTQEIGQMIKAIQDQVRHTVVSMERSQSEVSNGVDRATKAGDALKAIQESIRSVSEMMARISGGTTEQRRLVGDILQRVQLMNDGVDGTLDQTKLCDESCRDLAGRSAALHQEVGRFRIS